MKKRTLISVVMSLALIICFPQLSVEAVPIEGTNFFYIGSSWNADNGNPNVTQVPVVNPSFVIENSKLITFFSTYHMDYANNPTGPAEVFISLQRNDGLTFGPYSTTKGVYDFRDYVCYPNVEIPAGTYTVIDSDPDTWAHNTHTSQVDAGWVSLWGSDVLDNQAPVIGIDNPGGEYTDNVTVTLTPNETCNIYYTLDGENPTVSSSKYTGPIEFTESALLKYFAVDNHGNASNIATHIYNVTPSDKTAPVIGIDNLGGEYIDKVTVTLTPNETCNIYYTLDGENPTVNSSKYTGPIELTESAELKYFAVDSNGNSTEIYTNQYSIKQSEKEQILPKTGSGWDTSSTIIFGIVLVILGLIVKKTSKKSC